MKKAEETIDTDTLLDLIGALSDEGIERVTMNARDYEKVRKDARINIVQERDKLRDGFMAEIDDVNICVSKDVSQGQIDIDGQIRDLPTTLSVADPNREALQSIFKMFSEYEGLEQELMGLTGGGRPCSRGMEPQKGLVCLWANREYPMLEFDVRSDEYVFLWDRSEEDLLEALQRSDGLNNLEGIYVGSDPSHFVEYVLENSDVLDRFVSHRKLPEDLVLTEREDGKRTFLIDKRSRLSAPKNHADYMTHLTEAYGGSQTVGWTGQTYRIALMNMNLSLRPHWYSDGLSWSYNVHTIHGDAGGALCDTFWKASENLREHCESILRYDLEDVTCLR